MSAETVHRCPPLGSSVMPCCGRTPFEVSRVHRMTLDDALVTCTGMEPAEHPDRPHLVDPKCGRRPTQIREYVELAAEEGMDVDDFVWTNEGTLNPANGHFLCTACYINAGQPSAPGGWKCP